ncbi:hypothetical protein BX666DRAFT_1897634 [Dichotomocladium elegans]|nr:hypothetical protein BX666DRAFT_1897634 [Dichotomocladium elegans]
MPTVILLVMTERLAAPSLLDPSAGGVGLFLAPVIAASSLLRLSLTALGERPLIILLAALLIAEAADEILLCPSRPEAVGVGAMYEGRVTRTIARKRELIVLEILLTAVLSRHREGRKRNERKNSSRLHDGRGGGSKELICDIYIKKKEGEL